MLRKTACVQCIIWDSRRPSKDVSDSRLQNAALEVTGVQEATKIQRNAKKLVDLK